MSKKNKSSLLVGGLISSAGIFITKAIGLLYVAPFKAMVQAENYVYYAAGYELYDLMLTISLAGLPFAIAAIVSKYMEKEDYNSVMLVKQISMGLLFVFGLISSLAIVLFINRFVSTRGEITLEQAQIYKNVYLLMALSVFSVPILSSYRGFFQGIKEYNTYSLSQVIEQIVRVSFLLIVGAICVYVFKLERIYAVYVALIATAISALAAIFHLSVINRSSISEIEAKSKNSEVSGISKTDLIKELFYFALPFLLSVILANRFGFSNMLLLPKSLYAYGYSNLEVSLYTSLITNESIKLIGIPTVLATGFAVAIIPEMSEALTRNDYKQIQKSIKLSIESVLYIGLPILLIMYFLSEEIYFILFGGSVEIIKMGGNVLKSQVILAILGNLMPILNAMLMTLNLRVQTLKILLITFILNFGLLWILVIKIGWFGSMLAMIITTTIVIVYSLYILMKTYKVNFKYTIRKIILMIISLSLMIIPYLFLRFLNLDVISSGRVLGLVILGVYGILMLVVYLVVSNYLYLPQSILNMDFKKILKRVNK